MPALGVLGLGWFALASLCSPAWCQDTPPADTPTPDAPRTDATVDIEPVRVIGRRPARDPFAFDNPVQVEGTVFSRDWDEPPSPEEAGMRGGYVDMAIRWGLRKAVEGIRKVPGYTNQVVPAEARPPPLAHDQAARALRLSQGAGEAAGDAPHDPAAAAAGTPGADAAAADP